MNIFKFQNESTVPMSGTVIKFKFHYVHVLSKTVSSQCIIYSITSKLTIDLTLNYVKILEFQNGSTRKLTYNKVYR